PSYLPVLRPPQARPLLLASLVGRLANATGPLSVVLFVQEQTGSFAQAGATSAAIPLASGLLAPVRGRLVDRYGQRRCLAPMGLAFAAGLTGLVVVAGPGPAAGAAPGRPGAGTRAGAPAGGGGRARPAARRGPGRRGRAPPRGGPAAGCLHAGAVGLAGRPGPA